LGASRVQTTFHHVVPAAIIYWCKFFKIYSR
jgi:hypothetical protein